jgi:hypothetical protein
MRANEERNNKKGPDIEASLLNMVRFLALSPERQLGFA